MKTAAVPETSISSWNIDPVHPMAQFKAGNTQAGRVVSLLTFLLLFLLSVVSAVLMTAYVSGVTFANLRFDESLVVPALVGVLICAGLFLGDKRVRTIMFPHR